MEQVHRSVSQYNRYLACGEAYRLITIEKVPQQPAAWLAQGSAFHEAVRFWEESGRTRDIVQSYLFVYDEEILRMKTKEPDLKQWLRAPSKTTEQDIRERRERGANQALLYKNIHEQGPGKDTVIADLDEFTIGIEVPFEVSLGKVTIKGSIDQILLYADGYEVRDLKTGNREQSSLQLAVYKYAVEKIFGLPVTRASYYYAKDGKIAYLMKSQLSRYSEEYLADLFETLDRGIINEVYLPNPSQACMMCPVRKFCREMGENVRS